MVNGVKWGKYRIPRHVPDNNDEEKLLMWLTEQKETAQRFNVG